MSKVHREGNMGYVEQGGTGILTFEILSSTDQQSIEEDKATFDSLFKYGESFTLEGFTIATNGENNNLPGTARDFIKANPFLPEILKKETRFMYGQGPMLYVVEYDEENRKIRKPVDKDYPEFFEWLKSWAKSGLPPSREYFHKTIQSYYYGEDYYSAFHFNKSRRINGEMPIRGLESRSPVKCRKAMKGTLTDNESVADKKLKYIIIGKWDKLYRKEFEVFRRLDPADPLKHSHAINYTADFGFDEEIYACSTYFHGLKEWIRGSNLNPKYINSYLKNSLNAKLHVIIPDAWIKQKEETLRKICEDNQSAESNENPLVTEFDGLKEIGTRFDYSMLKKLIDIKLQQVAKVLSGSGENQGKTFWSRSFKGPEGTEEWQFKDIPIKYKEFTESILKFDKQAISVILAGKGLDPSISNISNEGIFGGSGSQSYYNYLIYLNSLPYAEEIICEEINMAAQINFPRMKKDNVVVGFYRHIPEKMEETPPKDRMEKVIQK